MSGLADSKIWGPYAWYFIHQVAFRLPHTENNLTPTTRKFLNSFFLTIRWLLPCPSCQKHYGWTLSKYPVSKYYSTGVKMSKWTVIAHNLTNKGLNSLGKGPPKKIYTYAAAKDLYLSPKGVHSKLNHGKLAAFIQIIIENSRDKPLSNRKSMATCVANLYPCFKCRKRLQNFLAKNSLKNVKSSSDMSAWAKRFRSVALKCK